ncbi:MAG: site-2 protease family protein [Gemmatimonadota bacterium]|nr:site-2 protease family protein [Gemmatimonadota bacterium]
MIEISMTLLIAALLLLGGTRGFAWRHLRSRRLELPTIRHVDPSELPPTLAPIFEAAERELLPIGFRRAGARWTESIDVCEGPRPELAYVHDESGALAFVGPPLPGMGDRPYNVSFMSRLKGDATVATFDGLAHLTPGFPPGWECFDHDLNDLGRQWAAHLHALSPHGGLTASEPVLPAAWDAIEQDALESTLASWERDGVTRRTSRPSSGRPRWRFRSGSAWAMGGRLLAGQRRVLHREAATARTRARTELWRSSVDVVTDPLEPSLDRAKAAAMAWGYEYTRDSDRCRRDARARWERWAMGFGSAAACLAVFGLWFGWELASVLCAVLLLHELGHVVGMAAFGYRDRRILFIPLFGAAALGEKDDATPLQRTVVLLAGPVPGLILGLVCMLLFFENGGLWWLAMATTALIVNYFNLLPISPLDGGRIVETLMLGRYPRAQVVFLAGGTVTLGLGAWVLRDPILAAMSLALIISLRAAWGAATGLVRVRARIESPMTPSERVRTVFETLQEDPFAKSPVAHRSRLAALIVPRLDARPARPRTAIAGALLYFGLLLGTPVAVATSIYAFQPQMWDSIVQSTRLGDALAQNQSSSVTISEASVVGR